MEYVLLTSNPVVTLLVLFLTVGLIIIGRQFEMPQFPMIIVIYSLGLLIYHTICIDKGVMESNAQLYISIAVDLLMLLLGFITYLWVDNIVAKKKNLKSYGDPLSWFWNKL